MDWELALDLIHGYLLKYSEVEPPHTHILVQHTALFSTQFILRMIPDKSWHGFCCFCSLKIKEKQDFCIHVEQTNNELMNFSVEFLMRIRKLEHLLYVSFFNAHIEIKHFWTLLLITSELILPLVCCFFSSNYSLCFPCWRSRQGHSPLPIPTHFCY